MKKFYQKYRREFSVVVAIIITFAFFGIMNPAYFSVANISTIITQSVTYGLMGIGMTCVIITGGIDLSVGSVLALVACVAAQLAKAGLPIPIWIALCLVIGFGLGIINGFLISKLHLQPFVATMGTMSIYRGLAYVITGGYPVLSVPKSYRNVFNSTLAPNVSVSVLIFFVFAIVMTIVMKKTRLGSHIYAIGGNEDATRLSGVRVVFTKVMAYGIAMLGTTLAAMILVGRLGTGDPSTGQGYELDVIAAAAIGGTSMAGGRGNIFGTVLGAILFSALKCGLITTGADTIYQFLETCTGSVIAAYLEIIQNYFLQKKSSKGAQKA